MEILKDGQWQDDPWQFLSDPGQCRGLDDIPPGAVILPCQLWQEHGPALVQRKPVPGLVVDGDTDLQVLQELLPDIPLIAVQFPVFTDGRGYSQARLLRERYRYRGELRATGDVLRDQLFFMMRCGIDSFALPRGDDPDGVLRSFQQISVRYQAACDESLPLYRRR